MPSTHDQKLSQINNQTQELQRLKRLFISRFLGSFVILTILTLLASYTGFEKTETLKTTFIIWLILSTIQTLLFRFKQLIITNLLAQLTSDFIIIGYLIYTSGGINSPLVLLLGVIIIIAGTQARVLVALFSAILAATTYLFVIYFYASHHNQPILGSDTLHLLLQISLFFLAGGIMAIVARRQSSLQQDKQYTSSQHQQLQTLHSQVLSTMQEGIIILNSSFMIKDFNTAASSIFSISKAKIDKHLYDILHIPSDLHDFINRPQFNLFKTEIHHHGQVLLITLSLLHTEQESWLMTIVNISETRELERQLAEQDKLASIGQVAAMLAHEIRNPMQTISQAVELMGLETQNDTLENIITSEINRLNRLVSDMLDYASPLHPHIKHSNILNTMQTSISQVDLNNTHRIQLHCPDISLHVDPDHIRLVSDNLIRNAMHASPMPESIEVSFEAHDTGWCLKVRDHGIGISESMRKTLFEPFRTNRKQGTGLGLATVWQVCQVNHWQIYTDEHVQDGACFVVTCFYPQADDVTIQTDSPKIKEVKYG